MGKAPVNLVNGRYALGRKLGEGSQGVTFLAGDRARKGAEVVLKIFYSSRLSDRALWEFGQLSRLDHDGIVRVHEMGTIQDAPWDAAPGLGRDQGFIVEDWVDGLPISEVVDAARARKGWIDRLAGLMLEIARSLSYLHERRLIHRDLKPGNILVRRRRGPIATCIIDFGLSLRTGSRSGGLAGTPGYIAPECLAGTYDAATDLYALGATAYRLATGSPPVRIDPDARPGEAIRAMITSRPVPAGEAVPDLPEWMAEAIDRLIDPDPAARFPSALALADHLERHAGGPGRKAGGDEAPHPRAGRPPFAGRREVVDGLTAWAASRISRVGSEVEPVTIVEGQPGIGKSATIAEAKRRLILSCAAEGREIPEFVDSDATDLASRIGGEAGRRPTVVVVAGIDQAGARAVAAAAAALAADPEGRAQVAVIVERDTAPGLAAAWLAAAEGVRVVRLEPLADEWIATIASFVLECGRDDDRVGRVVGASGGNPLYALEIASRLASGDAGDGLPGTVEGLVRQSVATLPLAERRLAEVVGLVAGPTGMDLAAEVLGTTREATYGAARALEERGMVRISGEAVLPGPMGPGMAATAMDAGRRATTEIAIGEAMASRGEAPAWESSLHLLRGGRNGGAAAVVAGAAAGIAAAGEPARAVPLMVEALPCLAGEERRQAALDLARLYRETGRYAEALALIDGSGGEGAGAMLEKARTLRLSGRPAEAGPIVDAILAGAARSGADRVEALALRARMLLDRGDAEGAAGILSGVDLEGIEPGTAAAAIEPLGMALHAAGRDIEALGAFGRGEAIARAAGLGLPAARFLSLMGRVRHGRGEYAEALACYEAALDLARKGGDSHAEGVYAMNAGAIHLERCVYDRAMDLLSSARRRLAALGDVRELPWVLTNLANLRARIGDPEGAVDLAGRARGIAMAQGQAAALPWIRMIEGDAARIGGDAAAALEAYDEAEQEAVRAGDPRGSLLARVAAADAASLLCGRDEATRRIEAAVSHPEFRDGSPEGDRIAIARARATAGGTGDPGPALGRLSAALAGFESRGDTEGALRASIVLMTGGGARSPEERGRLTLGIAACAAAISRASAPLGYDPLRADPEISTAHRMDTMTTGNGSDSGDRQRPTSSVPPTAADGKWKRLARINKRLNSETRLRPLLETILDTLLDLTGATRGFILTRDEEGGFAVRAARNIEEAGLPGGRRDFSSSIVKEVVEKARPVVTLDAAADERFDALHSVHELRLKSVICVPLLVRGRVTGAVYVDNPFGSAVFGGEDVELVMDFADQAAIALENARLMAENRRREVRIERLNRKLERALRQKQIELRGLRETIDRSLMPQEGAPRRYQELVGDSEPMRRLYSILDRICESDLPAVIVGESGTGKELVARAIHFYGPRRRGPFVGESCGAIPDTLLESVLFGHVKGAFTGADRTRPGLFEVASGGTLFLDEISSMSQSMQTKLLRTLQEGVIRPLGGSEEKKVDVRVIAAANRDLGALVKEGSFREDLYYRMNVVTIDVPPLRSRREDIPALARHFAAKHSPAGAEITRDAMARLLSYDWPGNVRELENEIMRAIVMGGSPITAEGVLAGKEVEEGRPGEGPPGDMDLKAQIDHLERGLVKKALARTHGNQSQAARLLGVSRFGLMKKMRRLGVG